jgi:similar to bacteriophage protein. putative transmembrane protein
MPLKGYIVLLDEFLYKIGFDVDSGKIKQIEQGLKNISSLAKQTAQPISDAVKAGMERNAELIAKLEQAKNQGVEWCEEAKGQAEELTTSFHEVAEAEEKVGEKAKEAAKETKKLTEKKPTIGLKQEFDGLRNKFLLIGAVATTVSGLIANYLTVPLQNIQELAKKKDRLFNITQAEIIQAKEYQDRLQDTKTAMQSITTQVALKLLPTVNQSLIGFNNFLKANKALVVEGLTNVFKWILKLGQVFTNTFRFLNKVTSSTIGWKAALLILVGVLAVVKRAMLAAFVTNPISWVIGLIGALVLLIDDLMTYLDGGEALLGGVWQSIIDGINWVKQTWADLPKYFDQFFSWLNEKFKNLFFALDSFGKNVKAFFVGISDSVKYSFETMINYIKSLYDKLITPIVDGITSLKNNIMDGANAAGSWLRDKSNNILNFLGFGDDAPKAALATQYADNNRSVQYNGGTSTTTININTNNPQMANQIINNRQKSDLAFTQANLRGGY